MLDRHDLMRKIEELTDAIIPEIVEIRRDMHRHPELAYEEERTSRIVRDWLRLIGFEVRTGLAKTGIVGLLRGSKEGRTLALRADMDALPITETTGLPYASQTQGKAHSCGHDGHTAILMGAAKVLSDLRSELSGNVKFVFQPAEEMGAGGERMCEDGVLSGPPVSAIFALHSWPFIRAGEIGVRHGVMTAISDRFEITVHGIGGHAAHPERAIDPIVMAAKIIDAFQTIVSRMINPLDPAVITVGEIRGGSAHNIIPDSVSLRGTIRSLDEETRNKVLTSMKQVVHSVASMFGAPSPRFDFIPGYPAVVNDDRMVQMIEKVGSEVLGEHKVRTLSEPSMGGEDFSYYLKHVPGAMFLLGVASSNVETSTPLHSANFDFNDEAIRTGMLMMTSIALEVAHDSSAPWGI